MEKRLFSILLQQSTDNQHTNHQQAWVITKGSHVHTPLPEVFPAEEITSLRATADKRASKSKMASAADRFNINSQLEHLQSRYVGTGHADTNRFEWAVNIHRDSYASYFGHHTMLQYFAVAENESIGRVKYNMMQVRALRGVGLRALHGRTKQRGMGMSWCGVRAWYSPSWRIVLNFSIDHLGCFLWLATLKKKGGAFTLAPCF